MRHSKLKVNLLFLLLLCLLGLGLVCLIFNSPLAKTPQILKNHTSVPGLTTSQADVSTTTSVLSSQEQKSSESTAISPWDKLNFKISYEPYPAAKAEEKNSEKDFPHNLSSLPANANEGEQEADSNAEKLPPEESPQAEVSVSAKSLEQEALEKTFYACLKDLNLADKNIACAFLDLNSGWLWGIEQDKHFNAASTIKIASALYTYEQMAAGTCQGSEVITLIEEDMEYGTGPISAAGVGLSYSLDQLLEASIQHSDNSAFHAIHRYWQNKVPEGWLVLALDRRYNLHYNNTRELSPYECIGMLYELYTRQEEIPGYQKLLFDMEHTSYPAMAASYIPDTVARKYGKLNGLYHDIGLVLGDKPFAFAIFTEGLPYPAESIAQLCLCYYQYLN